MLKTEVYRFYQYTGHYGNIPFYDFNLEQLAEELGMSIEKASLVIARHLLLTFPSSEVDSFPITSERLKGRTTQLSRAYDVMIQAHFQEKSCLKSPEVKALLGRAKKLKESRIDLYTEEYQNALLFHELLRTFPDRYRLEQPVDYSKEKKLFKWLDDYDPKPDRLVTLHTLEAFFFKQIAIYLEGKWFTWHQLAQKWAQTGGNGGNLVKFHRSLFFHWLVKTDGELKEEKHALSMKEYTYQKTLEALEGALHLEPVEGCIRQLFFEMMEQPQFRMDLVYYTGYAPTLSTAPFDPSREAHKWVRALKHYSHYAKRWRVEDKWKIVFWGYFIGADPDYVIPEVAEEKEISPFLPQVKARAMEINPVEWKKHAFEVMEKS